MYILWISILMSLLKSFRFPAAVLDDLIYTVILLYSVNARVVCPFTRNIF